MSPMLMSSFFVGVICIAFVSLFRVGCIDWVSVNFANSGSCIFINTPSFVIVMSCSFILFSGPLVVCCSNCFVSVSSCSISCSLVSRFCIVSSCSVIVFCVCSYNSWLCFCSCFSSCS